MVVIHNETLRVPVLSALEVAPSILVRGSTATARESVWTTER